MLKKLYLDSFRGLSREVWLLALVNFINRMGTMVIPFLSIYLTSELKFTLSDVGWIMAAFGFGSVVGTFIGGLLTDRIGYYKIMFWSLFLSGFLFISLQFITTFWEWVGLIFFATLVADLFRPASLTAVAVLSKPENRTRSVSLIRLAINMGWAFGPFIAGIMADHLGYSYLFWGDGLTCISAALFFWYAVPKKVAEQADDPELETTSTSSSVYNDWEYLFFIAMLLISAIAFFQLFTTIPLFFESQIGLTKTQIGLLMGLNGLLISIVEMPTVFLLEKKNINLQLAAFGAVLIGLSYFVLGFSVWWGVAVISTILVSIGEIFQMPFSNAYAVNRPKPENRGRYMALYGMAYSVAFVIAPPLGTNLVEFYGWNAMWFVISLFGVVSGIGLWALGQRKNKVTFQKESTIEDIKKEEVTMP